MCVPQAFWVPPSASSQDYQTLKVGLFQKSVIQCSSNCYIVLAYIVHHGSKALSSVWALCTNCYHPVWDQCGKPQSGDGEHFIFLVFSPIAPTVAWNIIFSVSCWLFYWLVKISSIYPWCGPSCSHTDFYQNVSINFLTFRTHPTKDNALLCFCHVGNNELQRTKEHVFQMCLWKG